MTRVFFRLYLLLVLPLILLAILPVNPISIIGNWWFEENSQATFGAIYPLIMDELEGVPQSEWQEKVKSINKHFAYSLELKKTHEADLDKGVLDRLQRQGYALNAMALEKKLIHRIENTDFLLFSSMYDYESEMDLFEKQTRGFRYLINKTAFSSDNPVKEFNRIKPYFDIDLELTKTTEFKQGDEVMQSLMENGIYFRRVGKKKESYVLSDNKKYIVSYSLDNELDTIRGYYKYFTVLFPAILLGIGALIWLFLFRQELTTLKKASAALGDGNLQTRTHLSKNSTLYELSESFNQMAGRIEQLLEDHKDLTNAVSHELKTPISRLRFALEMQQESTNNQEATHYTHQIENNIQALQDLIDELLGYTRMQREKQLNLQAHDDVSQWISHEIDLFADYHPSIGFNCETSVNQTIYFDPLQLSRVLNNLLDNATKHCQSAITVSACNVDNEFLLTVEDDGQGLPATDCEKIFEPFTRLDKSRQYNKELNKGGYGLGLAIVKSIILLHQGQISCQSSPMGGAAFIVRFPCKND